MWHAATTTPAERQEIARLLLESVTVTVVGQSEQVEVRLSWKGGHVSVHALTRPVDRYAHRSDYARLLGRIQELSDSGLSLAAVAEQLNRGRVPCRPSERQRFTGRDGLAVCCRNKSVAARVRRRRRKRGCCGTTSGS